MSVSITCRQDQVPIVWHQECEWQMTFVHRLGDPYGHGVDLFQCDKCQHLEAVVVAKPDWKRVNVDDKGLPLPYFTFLGGPRDGEVTVINESELGVMSNVTGLVVVGKYVREGQTYHWRPEEAV